MPYVVRISGDAYKEQLFRTVEKVLDAVAPSNNRSITMSPGDHFVSGISESMFFVDRGIKDAHVFDSLREAAVAARRVMRAMPDIKRSDIKAVEAP